MLRVVENGGDGGDDDGGGHDDGDDDHDHDHDDNADDDGKKMDENTWFCFSPVSKRYNIAGLAALLRWRLNSTTRSQA